jgi:hypothetical protein
MQTAMPTRRSVNERAAADVAVYAPYAGAFYASPPRPSGGAELQTRYLVHALAQAGLRVRHIVADVDGPLEADGVGVVPLSRDYARGGTARRVAVLRALEAADAHLYVQRSAGFETGFVGAFARMRRRRFVFASSSAADFDLRRRTMVRAGASLDHWPTRMQYRIGLKAANKIVVQTREQATLAHELGIQPTVIPNFCEPAPRPDCGPGEAFLWVGGLLAFKDPLAYVDLAAAVPAARFWMVATDRGPQWRGLADEVRRRAARLANLELLPPRGRDALLELYTRAVAIVTTSHFEGFPNTLLEAWARGTPALSLRLDPDGVIERHGLGAVAGGSIGRLAATAAEWWRDPRRAAAAGIAASAYIRATHALEVVGPQWVRLVTQQL